MSAILNGSVGSLLAGLATGAGALPLLGLSRLDQRHGRQLLGFAAGVMLAASLLSLIIPAFEAARSGGSTVSAALALVSIAVVAGALAVAGLKRVWRPPTVMGSDGDGQWLPPDRVWMFIAAIGLHNVPEGLAVGVSFHSAPTAGISTALGIGLQNMPEGLAVAALLASLGWSRAMSVLMALASGLVEPVAGLLGAVAVNAIEGLLPWALGAAAGAMLQVILADIMPEVSRITDRAGAVQAAVIGGLAMTLLDATLS